MEPALYSEPLPKGAEMKSQAHLLQSSFHVQRCAPAQLANLTADPCSFSCVFRLRHQALGGEESNHSAVDTLSARGADLARHPLYAAAEAGTLIASLSAEARDALFIPEGWWCGMGPSFAFALASCGVAAARSMSQHLALPFSPTARCPHREFILRSPPAGSPPALPFPSPHLSIFITSCPSPVSAQAPSGQ